MTQSITARSGTETTAYVITPYDYETTVTTDPKGNVFHDTYLGDGDFFSSDNPLVLPGHPSYGQYDADNRLTFSADQHERLTLTHYDADSRVTAEQIDDQWATYTYDNDGRVVDSVGRWQTRQL